MTFPHPIRLACVLLALLISLSFLHADSAESASPDKIYTAPPNPIERYHQLKDRSTDTLGVLGPFYWARAMDLSEAARFSDDNGRPDRAGSNIWFFSANQLKHPLAGTFHSRNNLLARDTTTSYRVQPKQTILHTSGSHNAKIDVGYAEKNYRFLHRDNEDMVHHMGCPRVTVHIPIRKPPHSDPYNQKYPYISPDYGGQSFSVLELKPDEIISYEWYRNPKKLHPNILFDLAPIFGKDNLIRPGVTEPLIQFDIHGEGKWTLKIEPDGRDGLKGGKNEAGWDYVFTEKSPGAKPYTVDLSPNNTRFAMSVYTPHAKPVDAAELLIGMQPYNRATGKDTEWTDRKIRIRNVKLNRVDQAIKKAKEQTKNWQDQLK